jgi:hypothetical protein
VSNLGCKECEVALEKVMPEKAMLERAMLETVTPETVMLWAMLERVMQDNFRQIHRKTRLEIHS